MTHNTLHEESAGWKEKKKVWVGKSNQEEANPSLRRDIPGLEIGAGVSNLSQAWQQETCCDLFGDMVATAMRVMCRHVHGTGKTHPANAPIFKLISSHSFPLHPKSSGFCRAESLRPAQLSSGLSPISGATRLSVRQCLPHVA